MDPNPYESPEGRGTKGAVPVANWWKVPCLVSVGMAVGGTLGVNYIESEGFFSFPRWTVEICYLLCVLTANAGVFLFVVTGIGWLVSRRRSR